MIPITKLTGRLGNQMFQFAFLYAYARENNLPLSDDALGYYYQDEKHFEKYAEGIRQLFSKGISEDFNQLVGIHVRRTDMVTNNFDVNLSETDYYERAIEMFPGKAFIVFSDDINWCINKWGHDTRFTFSHGDEITDFNRMAGCEHIITANSSFSWWAAYLNPNPNKKIICPKFEYIDRIERRKRPESWIRI